MVALPADRLTPEQYLELEAKRSSKHEYIDGRAYAMAGTTDTHNAIIGNLFVAARNCLRGSECRAYFTDIKVRLEERNCFYYPDLFVTCDPRDRETSTYKRFPRLIIEVLSESTEAFDRGDKFHDYQTLSSLEEYVLVNSKRQQVEIFRRNEQGLWVYRRETAIAETFVLHSLTLSVSFADLHEDTEL